MQQSYMIVRTVQNMVKKRALEVGIKVNMYLHMLRHAMIIHFLQSSHDLRSTQEFLEYSSIKSTKVYGQCYPKVKKS